MKIDADIDIDFADRDSILKLIKHTPARQESNVESKQHNSGVYVTDIPYDPIHNCANIDYKEADTRGYFKIDFLNVSVYQHIKDYNHYNKLLEQEPPWERLLEKQFCQQIIHIGDHYNLVQQMKPDSIPRMAMFLSVIRPAKKYLIGKSWKDIAKEIWIKPEDDAYYFKKSHSLSYAVLVGLHMNIIDQDLLQA
jgi:hypothetical protein